MGFASVALTPRSWLDRLRGRRRDPAEGSQNLKIRRTPTYWEGYKIFEKEGEDVSGHLIRPLVEHFVSSVTRRTQSVSVPRVLRISDRYNDTRD